ncbi:MAG: glycosyltransferase family 4 protein [Nanoarchaeota archaeon]|nr:glycosyltransferase family 4 protein [Nanoarchaeota archaeon]
MNILQIAPIVLPITPDMKYGGTERIVLLLDKEFTRLGHNSLVGATGDSKLQGKLIQTLEKSLWGIKWGSSHEFKEEYEEHFAKILEYSIINKVDIIHDHTGRILQSNAYQNLKYQLDPLLITLHGAPNIERKREIYGTYKDAQQGVYFNAISESQKEQFSEIVPIKEVVYHGIDLEKYPFSNENEDYLFSLGRIADFKGQHIAIEVAKKLGKKLVIAGNVHPVNQEYFEKEIKPHIDDEQIKYIGELTDEEKVPWYQRASCFLMPINWEEPFGLVMIESMGCGTPVVAFNRGSVKEVIENGKTGYVIENQNLEGMIDAVKNISTIKPEDCRARVEDYFTSPMEAQNYLNLYNNILNS